MTRIVKVSDLVDIQSSGFDLGDGVIPPTELSQAEEEGKRLFEEWKKEANRNKLARYLEQLRNSQ